MQARATAAGLHTGTLMPNTHRALAGRPDPDADPALLAVLQALHDASEPARRPAP